MKAVLMAADPAGDKASDLMEVGCCELSGYQVFGNHPKIICLPDAREPLGIRHFVIHSWNPDAPCLTYVEAGPHIIGTIEADGIWSKHGESIRKAALTRQQREEVTNELIRGLTCPPDWNEYNAYVQKCNDIDRRCIEYDQWKMYRDSPHSVLADAIPYGDLGEPIRYMPMGHWVRYKSYCDEMLAKQRTPKRFDAWQALNGAA